MSDQSGWQEKILLHIRLINFDYWVIWEYRRSVALWHLHLEKIYGELCLNEYSYLKSKDFHNHISNPVFFVSCRTFISGLCTRQSGRVGSYQRKRRQPIPQILYKNL